MVQLGRNLTDAAGGFLKDARHLIVDRDPLYTSQFEGTLKAAGVQLVRTPPSSPNLNAFAERFVRSVRQECLRHVVPLGERHLRYLLAQYVEHYHHERNHQGIGNAIPLPQPRASAAGSVLRRQRLGGILNFYERQAA
jgi:transposase InsO family protein